MTRVVSAALLSFGLAVVLGAQAPPPAPTGQQPVRVGGDIRPPVRTRYVQPVYPADAKAARMSGIVFLEATIDDTGKVTNLRVVKTAGEALDNAALASVRQWEYEPTTVAGKPVAVLMTVTVNFSLDGSGAGTRGGGMPLPIQPEPPPFQPGMRRGTPPVPGGMRGGGPPVPAPYDLTGVWRGNDGGTYQLRTIGVELFWSGRGEAGAWANAFHGGWIGEQYSGRFVDLPPGSIANDGMIMVRPITRNLIEIVGDAASFKTRQLDRVGPPVNTGPPPPGPTRGIGIPGAGRMGSAPPAQPSPVPSGPIPTGQFGAGAYRAGAGSISGPWAARSVQPQYTSEAMRDKIQGTVELEAVVKDDGTVGDVRVVRSLDKGLDERAMDALKQWQFTPAQDAAGRKVPALVTIEMQFRVS